MQDDRTTLRPALEHCGELAWTEKSNRFGWSRYLGRKPTEGMAPQYAVPARRGDLAGLPPAWIGVGTLDLFHDEDVDYARRLEAAGVACSLDVVPGAFHASDTMLDAPTASRFRTRMLLALRDGLGLT